MREHRISEGLNGETEKHLIRRKLMPVDVTIDKKGVFKTFRIKLSPKVSRVTGIVATADTMVAPPSPEPSDRWYAGPSNSPDMFDGKRITRLRYTGTFDKSFFEISFELGKSQWGYYAQPQRLNFFNVSSFNREIPLSYMTTIPVTDPDTGLTEPYDVWRTDIAGPGALTIGVEYEHEPI